MRERAVDQLLEVLDGRFASKYGVTHTTLPGSTTTAGDCKARSDEFWRISADYTIMRAVVCPLCGDTARPARLSGARPANLRGLLRHQAARRDRSARATAPSSPARASIRRRSSSPAAARRRRCSCRSMRDFNERQSQLFLARSATFLVRYEPPELQPLIDDDVAEAMAALAATFETAARGVDLRASAGVAAGRAAVTALKPVLPKPARAAASPFERDAAVVLRRHRGSGARGPRARTPTIAARSSICLGA